MNVRFKTSLRFELCYALQAVTDQGSRLHPDWCATMRRALPETFAERFERLGATSVLWAVLPDVLDAIEEEPSFEAMLIALDEMPTRPFQRRLLAGLLHQETLAQDLVDGKRTLAAALGHVPRSKQEWLAFVGLYPFEPDLPLAVALQRIIDDPEGFREDLLELFELFWSCGFRETWIRLEPMFKRSLAEKERLFAALPFSEFAQRALLRIEVEDDVVKAIRGGFRMSLSKVDRCLITPSAFNDKRYWSAYETDRGTYDVYFPYFDPSIALDESTLPLFEPELDAAMIFKALGDSTRYAIATLLTREPRTSVELSRLLSVSKPTISHHVHTLREAGLLDERHVNGAVELSLRRETLDGLSRLAIHQLYESQTTRPITMTRSKK